VSDHIGLRRQRAVQSCAADEGEIGGDAEVVEDPLGEYPGLRRGDAERISAACERVEQLVHSVVEPVFEDAFFGEILP